MTDPTNVSASAARQVCYGDGCWSLYESYQAGFHGTVHYGIHGTELGTATFDNRDTYAGAHLTTRMTWETQTGNRISDLRFTTLRLNTSGTGPGSGLTPPQSVLCGGVTTCQKDVVLQYATSSEQSTWHEANWWLPGVRGHFWFVAKSLEAYKNSAGGFTFYPNEYLPQNPQQAGWTK